MPLRRLLANNRAWADQVRAGDAEFFGRLSAQQHPQYLWIGCADSRVPANQIIGLPPGEVFVHRNVANLVVHSDLNCLSVLQYSVDHLQVRDIIVCGHYGCGGVVAALQDLSLGLVTNWIRHVQDVRNDAAAQLARCSAEEQADRLCELNVIAQVRNVCHTTVVRDAWERGQPLAVHGLIYGVHDGLLKDLRVSINSPEAVDPVIAAARETRPA